MPNGPAGTPPGYDDSSWGAVAVNGDVHPNLVAQAGPPVRVDTVITPVARTEPKPGVFVFDLGQNMVGWNRLTVSGPAGTTVTMRNAEVLNPDGTIYTANLRGAVDTDHYTLKGGGTETYEPRFTYRGYRYVEVTGYPGTPATDAVAGVVAHADAPPNGTFDHLRPARQPDPAQHRVGAEGQLLQRPHRLPAARRAARLDR